MRTWSRGVCGGGALGGCDVYGLEGLPGGVPYIFSDSRRVFVSRTCSFSEMEKFLFKSAVTGAAGRAVHVENSCFIAAHSWPAARSWKSNVTPKGNWCKNSTTPMPFAFHADIFTEMPSVITRTNWKHDKGWEGPKAVARTISDQPMNYPKCIISHFSSTMLTFCFSEHTECYHARIGLILQ